MNKCVLFLHTTYYIYIPPFLFFLWGLLFFMLFFCFVFVVLKQLPEMVFCINSDQQQSVKGNCSDNRLTLCAPALTQR